MGRYRKMENSSLLNLEPMEESQEGKMVFLHSWHHIGPH